MTTAVELLPREAQPFERAAAAGISDELPVPIRQLLDPAATRPEFLPFLVAHESADLWFEDWPEERKRQMAEDAKNGIASLKGSRAAFGAFLPYVDAEIIDRVSHPRRFVLGRSAYGLQPIGHKPFTTHLLVRVPLKLPANAFIIGRSAYGRAAFRNLDQTPLRRVERALVVAKSEDTLVSVNYGHRRPVTLDDGSPLDGSFRFGGYLDRKRL